MSKLKILGVLVGITGTLAFSVIPAYAEFKSKATPEQTRGRIHALSAAVFKDEGAMVECPASGIEAQYQIQVKGQIKRQLESTKKGPYLNIQVKNWGNCTTLIGMNQTKDKVKPCGFREAQRQTTEASIGVAEGCTIAIGEEPVVCEFQLPTGMETASESDQGINVGLKKATLANTGNNQKNEIVLNGGGRGQLAGEGLFFVQIPNHVLCGVSNNESGEFMFNFEAVELNA